MAPYATFGWVRLKGADGLQCLCARSRYVRHVIYGRIPGSLGSPVYADNVYSYLSA